MPKYRVLHTRTTIYELSARHGQQAIENADDSDVAQRTSEFEAIPLCPDCGDELTDRTTRTVTHNAHGPSEEEENTYCDTCDREVAIEDEGN